MSDQMDFEITTRPFLGDMLAPVAPTHGSPAPGAAAQNHHLFAAVTGARPLHIVDDEDVATVLVAPETSGQLMDLGTTAGDDEHRSRARARRREGEIRPLGYLQVDWAVVRELTRELTVSDATGDGEVSGGRPRSSFDVATASADPEDAVEERTLAEISRVIDRYTTKLVGRIGPDHDWTELQKAHYRQAIFDQAHRYGRLQQYLREPDVEDISIVGPKNVVVTKTNGLVEKRAPIAESDDELEDLVAEIASHRNRTFTKPNGHLDLDIGGARLSATGVNITSTTNVTIRKHNLIDVTLADMVEKGTMSQKIADFLTAGSRANLSTIVAGFPSAGKTTMIRALMSTIRPEEKVVTIETERELGLEKLPERHWQVQDLQYIPPQASAADSTAGFSLEQCLLISLRSSAMRLLFAEMRGPEAPIAIKAMQAGKGSMSTIHARSADDAIHRFADMLMSELGLSDDSVPLRQIERCIDLILYIDFIENPDGTRRRVVTEVAEVQRNDDQQPLAALLFQYDAARGTWTSPEKPTTELEARLRRVGYSWEEVTR